MKCWNWCHTCVVFSMFVARLLPGGQRQNKDRYAGLMSRCIFWLCYRWSSIVIRHWRQTRFFLCTGRRKDQIGWGNWCIECCRVNTFLGKLLFFQRLGGFQSATVWPHPVCPMKLQVRTSPATILSWNIITNYRLLPNFIERKNIMYIYIYINPTI